MKIKKIPRIGVAVKDLEKAKDFFINVLGAKKGSSTNGMKPNTTTLSKTKFLPRALSHIT